MKFTVLGLAFLFSAMSWVHCQTVPYVSFMGTNLSNHSYVDMNLVGSNGDGSDSVKCHTDLDTCCNRNVGPDRGDWYFPNMSRLQFRYNNTLIYESRLHLHVQLRRENGGNTSGIYRCDIETIAVHSDEDDVTTRETVYVGLYISGGEKVKTF